MAGRRWISRLALYDTPVSRVIAGGGLVLAAVGFVGLLLLPRLLLIWVAMLAFGLSTVPRAIREWLRERRSSRD